MQELTVICGECGAEVPLTESLAAPLLEASRRDFEKKLAEKNKELKDQAAEMEKRRATLSDAENALDTTIQERVKTATQALALEADKKTQIAVAEALATQETALRDSTLLVESRTEALKKVTETASNLRKDKADLEEEKLRLAATIEDKVGEELRKARIRYQKDHEVDLEKKLLEKDAEVAKEKLALKRDADRNQIAKDKEAQKVLDDKIGELALVKKDLQGREGELAAAKQAEAALMKTKRELENEKRQMPLLIQLKVDEELVSVRQSIRGELEGDFKLKVREKDLVLEGMKKEIENLRRKAEQGSQQIQGEVWEKEVSELLTQKFTGDKIRRVAKGESGADIVQDVYNVQGKLCGSLLWESKRTANWNNDWLAKLKKDQRTIKADTAVIVSHALPKDMTTFDNREDVWVTSPACLIPVAGALRHLLIEVASTKRSNEGHQEKAALVYEYVTSLPFRERVKAMVETYTTMQVDLKAEQRAINRLWAKREAQLDRMIEATGGMYGDLQGIAGQNVPELEGLSLERLGEGT